MNRAVAVILVVVLAACGVRTDDEPRPLPAENVPFDLLAPETSAAVDPAASGVRVTVWFVDNAGLLARARRTLPPPVTVEAVLDALLDGVTDAEADNGLRTNITSDTEVNEVEGPDDGLVTVDLTSDFLAITRELQRLALAQVVFTVTSLPNVDRVLFEFDGEPAQVPGAGDELTSAPLTKQDFAQFDPAATTTTIRP